jgi:phenylalanyl-tRNA synthetase beta subunit
MNQKLPVDKFAIFEINKVFQKEWGETNEKVPVEKMHLGFVVAERKNNQTAFYKAKKYVDLLLKSFNIRAKYEPLQTKNAEALPFEPKRTALVTTLEGEYLGVVGEFRNSVRQEFKLGEYLAGFEIDFDKMLSLKDAARPVYVGKTEFRDLTVATNKGYGEVIAKIEKVLADYALEADILPLGIYQAEGDEEKHISVRLVFRSFDNKVMKALEAIK